MICGCHFPNPWIISINRQPIEVAGEFYLFTILLKWCRDLSSNQLNGSIPPNFAGLPFLQNLYGLLKLILYSCLPFPRPLMWPLIISTDHSRNFPYVKISLYKIIFFLFCSLQITSEQFLDWRCSYNLAEHHF